MIRLVARVVPLDAPVSAPRPDACRLCDSRGRRSQSDPTLCAPCHGRLLSWARDAVTPLGEGLARMEGAWPLGELDEVARDWRRGTL